MSETSETHQKILEWMRFLMHIIRVRTTITIDDDLVAKAAEFSGIADKSKLINFTLDAYIRKMAAKRLAALGGTMPDFDVPGRGGMGSYRTQWTESSKVADAPQ